VSSIIESAQANVPTIRQANTSVPLIGRIHGPNINSEPNRILETTAAIIPLAILDIYSLSELKIVNIINVFSLLGTFWQFLPK